MSKHKPPPSLGKTFQRRARKDSKQKRAERIRTDRELLLEQVFAFQAEATRQLVPQGFKHVRAFVIGAPTRATLHLFYYKDEMRIRETLKVSVRDSSWQFWLAQFKDTPWTNFNP